MTAFTFLHTADIHLGATFGEVGRELEHDSFFQWLLAQAVSEDVDGLIIAGDVFDHAQPSAQAQSRYYRFLRDISATGVQTVIVGGNHDSGSRLDAPALVLASLGVFVIGNGTFESGRCDPRMLVTLQRGTRRLVVAAVPYVHEYRLGVRPVDRQETASGPIEHLIREQFQSKFTAMYSALTDRALAMGTGPVVATGHLACAGTSIADAPVEIHRMARIGGLAPDVFDQRLSYVALGHIHAAHQVNDRTFYPGSPIGLTLREFEKPRTVLRVEIADSGTATVRSLEVPTLRRIVEVRGNELAASEQIRELTWATPYPPILSAILDVERYVPGLEQSVRKAVTAFGSNGPVLARVRQNKRRAEPLTALAPSVGARSLTVQEVFERLCQERGEPLDPELLEAFRSVAEEQET